MTTAGDGCGEVTGSIFHREVERLLRWAYRNDWRPWHPEDKTDHRHDRGDDRYGWTNQVEDPGTRQAATLAVFLDTVAGTVEVRQLLDPNGWSTIGWFRVGSWQAIFDILAAMSVVPVEHSDIVARAARSAARRAVRTTAR